MLVIHAADERVHRLYFVRRTVTNTTTQLNVLYPFSGMLLGVLLIKPLQVIVRLSLGMHAQTAKSPIFIVHMIYLAAQEYVS